MGCYNCSGTSVFIISSVLYMIYYHLIAYIRLWNTIRLPSTMVRVGTPQWWAARGSPVPLLNTLDAPVNSDYSI